MSGMIIDSMIRSLAPITGRVGVKSRLEELGHQWRSRLLSVYRSFVIVNQSIRAFFFSLLPFLFNPLLLPRK